MYEQIKKMYSEAANAIDQQERGYRQANAAGQTVPYDLLVAADELQEAANRALREQWNSLSAHQRGALKRMYGDLMKEALA